MDDMQRSGGQRATVSVELEMPGGNLAGEVLLSKAQVTAAWELYVELVTRITIVELEPGAGLLREALSSLHTLFDTTRRILREHGPAVAVPEESSTPQSRLTVGVLAVSVLNKHIRPLLLKWHHELRDYEEAKPPDRSVREHERLWVHNAELRNDLSELRGRLKNYAKVLEKIIGIKTSMQIS